MSDVKWDYVATYDEHAYVMRGLALRSRKWLDGYRDAQRGRRWPLRALTDAEYNDGRAAYLADEVVALYDDGWLR